jgi:hypothetical protein
MARVLLGLVFFFAGGVAAASNADDGFIWVDANTKIRLKPIIGSAAAGGTKAPERKKEEEKKKAAPKK